MQTKKNTQSSKKENNKVRQTQNLHSLAKKKLHPWAATIFINQQSQSTSQSHNDNFCIKNPNKPSV